MMGVGYEKDFPFNHRKPFPELARVVHNSILTGYRFMLHRNSLESARYAAGGVLKPKVGFNGIVRWLPVRYEV